MLLSVPAEGQRAVPASQLRPPVLCLGLEDGDEIPVYVEYGTRLVLLSIHFGAGLLEVLEGRVLVRGLIETEDVDVFPVDHCLLDAERLLLFKRYEIGAEEEELAG